MAIGNPAYYDQIQIPAMHLLDIQWDINENIDENNDNWGGWGYSKSDRPDLSNSQFAIMALNSANGENYDENLWLKAIKYIVYRKIAK